MQTLDQQLDTRQLRRMRTESRQLDRMERNEKKAEALVGELCREGKTVYYINITDKAGRFTGKTKESPSFHELVNYLVRNHYI